MNSTTRQIGNISLLVVGIICCCSCSTHTIPLIDTDAGTSKDAKISRDVGRDTTYGEIEDIIEDISLEDTFIEDVDLDGGYEDTPSDVESDGGFSDVLEDIAGDAGDDISINVRIPSLYDMSAGSVRSGEYEIKTVTGNSARPTIDINGVKSYITKNK